MAISLFYKGLKGEYQMLCLFDGIKLLAVNICNHCIIAICFMICT